MTMPDANEILNGLKGAWRIMARDPGAPQFFNLSAGGFQNSFMALALTLPVLFFTATSLWRMALTLQVYDDTDFTAFAFVQIGGSMIYWVVYLIAMIPIARSLGLGGNFLAYVITFNWGTLLTSGLFALPLVLYSISLAPGPVAIAMTLPALAALAWYRWQIARSVLGAQPSGAIAILIFDFTLGALIDHGLGVLMLRPGGGA